MNRFQTDTAVEPRGDGRYRARIDRGWWIVRGPNGGYVAAILLRAMAHAVADEARRPRSLTVHFLAPPAEGAADVTTCIERTGRSLTTATARLEQDGRLLAIAIAAFSKPRSSPAFQHVACPEVSPPERLQSRTRRADASPVGMHERYESRLAVGGWPFSGATEPLSGGWIRLSEEPGPIEAPLIAAYTDAWPPALMAPAEPGSVMGGVPTVDLTVHFRADYPADADPADFVLAIFRTQMVRDGFLEEEGEIFTRSGLLLAQSRQLGVYL